MESIPSEPAYLTGLYDRNFLANFAGNCIIVMLNIFTPLSVYENWKAFIWQGGLVGGWIIIPITLFVVVWMVIGMQYFLECPISTAYRQLQDGNKLSAELLETAKRRLVNLPSILALTNLILWVALTCIFIPPAPMKYYLPA